MEWTKRTIGLAVGIAVAIIAIIAVSVLQYRITITNEGERMQERVETLYKGAQNSLSTCLDQGRVAAQVTQQEFEAVRGILVDTASARYTGPDGQASDAAAAIGTGRAFSAVIENYPAIDQRSWQSLQSTVVGCRDEFRGAQDRLFIDAMALDQWRLSDNLFNQEIKNNFPTRELDVTNPSTSETLTGEAALEYMTRVIMVAEAQQAYDSGTLGEQDLFGEQ